MRACVAGAALLVLLLQWAPSARGVSDDCPEPQRSELRSYAEWHKANRAAPDAKYLVRLAE
jgi:hypothetical protein